MLIIPAIDIKDKKVVRLERGDFSKVTVYADDPVSMALKWQEAGAKLIHIVDLDAAKTGLLKNLDVVEKIVENVKVPVEVGGGIRDEKVIGELIEKGINKIVLGTKALDRTFLKRVLKKFNERLVVSIDAKKGAIAIKGWQESGNIDPVTFAKELEEMGVRRIVYTDILKDGTLEGPSFFNIERLLDNVNIEVIASGGVSNIDDLRKLKTYQMKGLKGVIVGKAIYEEEINLEEAIRELE